jgi:hypothetical protein
MLLCTVMLLLVCCPYSVLLALLSSLAVDSIQIYTSFNQQAQHWRRVAAHLQLCVDKCYRWQ